MDLLAGRAERISVAGANASRRIGVSAGLYM